MMQCEHCTRDYTSQRQDVEHACTLRDSEIGRKIVRKLLSLLTPERQFSLYI